MVGRKKTDRKTGPPMGVRHLCSPWAWAVLDSRAQGATLLLVKEKAAEEASQRQALVTSLYRSIQGYDLVFRKTRGPLKCVRLFFWRMEGMINRGNTEHRFKVQIALV